MRHTTVRKLCVSSHRRARAAGKLTGMSAPDSLNRAKARRAAVHPDRPGEECGAPPGSYVITVDHNRCEGKADCVEVCPYTVFEVRRIDDADYARLGVLGKLK